MNLDLSFLRERKFWKDMLLVLLGTMMCSAAVYYFLMPGKLILGSISGLAMVVSEVLGGYGITMKVSVLVLLFNTVLLVLAYIFLDSEVGTKTLVSSMLIGPFMDLFEFVLPYTSLMEPGTTSVMNDPLLDLVAFVLLLSMAQAVLFRINASSGGTEIIALLMKKYMHIEIGTSLAVSGILVCLTAFSIHPFRMVLIGIIGTWLNGVVVDYFTATLNKRKRVCVVCDNYEAVRRFIIEDLNRGCSIYTVIGGYSGKENMEVQSLLTQGEFANLMQYIRDNNIKAFITAGNCSEVYGLWSPGKHFRHVI